MTITTVPRHLASQTLSDSAEWRRTGEIVKAATALGGTARALVLPAAITAHLTALVRAFFPTASGLTVSAPNWENQSPPEVYLLDVLGPAGELLHDLESHPAPWDENHDSDIHGHLALYLDEYLAHRWDIIPADLAEPDLLRIYLPHRAPSTPPATLA